MLRPFIVISLLLFVGCVAVSFVLLTRSSTPETPAQNIRPRQSTQKLPARKSLRVEGSGFASLGNGPVAPARLRAEREAKLDALSQLIDEVTAAEIERHASVEGYVVDRDAIATVAQSYRVIDTKYYSDGSVDVVAELSADVLKQLDAPSVVSR